MTHGAFLEYLYVNDCTIYKQVDTYYKFRKKGTTGSKNMSGLPIMESTKEMRPFTICQICHNLGIAVPDEVKEAEGVLAVIRDKHMNDAASEAENEDDSPKP